MLLYVPRGSDKPDDPPRAVFITHKNIVATLKSCLTAITSESVTTVADVTGTRVYSNAAVFQKKDLVRVICDQWCMRHVRGSALVVVVLLVLLLLLLLCGLTVLLAHTGGVWHLLCDRGWSRLGIALAVHDGCICGLCWPCSRWP